MAALGRPPLLDQLKKQQICALVRAGGDLETAARYIGCSPRTIHRAARTDRNFAQSLTGAFAGAEIEPVNSHISRSRKSWRAAARYLERHCGYGRISNRRVHNRRVDPGQLATVARLIGKAMLAAIDDPEQRSTADHLKILTAQWLERERQAARELTDLVSLGDEPFKDDQFSDEQRLDDILSLAHAQDWDRQ